MFGVVVVVGGGGGKATSGLTQLDVPEGDWYCRWAHMLGSWVLHRCPDGAPPSY